MRRRRLLLGVAAAFTLALAGALAVSAVALYRGPHEAGARPADEQPPRDDLKRALAATDARLAALGGELASTAAALREREAWLEALARRLSDVEREVQAGERLLQAYAGGVALIQATVRYAT